jgi:hypothetical protein
MEWILGIGVAAFLIVWFLRRSKNEALHNKNDIKALFDRLRDDLTVIQDVAVPVQGGMGQIDFVALSSCEVFVTSVIHAQGKIQGDINSREWQAGKETIYNPVWRNRLLVNGLEPILKNIRLVPLIVFTNGKLIDDFDANVIEFRNLKKFFKKREKKELVDSSIIESALETLRKLKKLG